MPTYHCSICLDERTDLSMIRYNRVKILVCPSCYGELNILDESPLSRMGAGNPHPAVPRSQVQYDGSCRDW